MLSPLNKDFVTGLVVAMNTVNLILKANSMTTDHADFSALSFEDGLLELEGIVSQLETGQVPLEQSLSLYQRGAALKALCEERLKAARLKVEAITLSKSGQAEGLAPASFDN
jgi:exodeoxyribonuclease VII small subunit